MLTMVAEQADWVQKIHGKSLDENLDKDAEMSKVRVESGKYFVCSRALVDYPIFIPGLHWEETKSGSEEMIYFWGIGCHSQGVKPHFKTGE